MQFPAKASAQTILRVPHRPALVITAAGAYQDVPEYGSAIIVTGDKFEVLGKWKVAVHDNRYIYQPWEQPYDVLSQGDVYIMKTRKIEKLGNEVTPARRGEEGR